jgi:ATP-dependent Lon protease
METSSPVLIMSNPVLFPGMILPIHLTTDRDVAAIEVHMSAGRPLVVVPPLVTGGQRLSPKDLFDVGCLAQVNRCLRLGDGSLRVLIEGVERVRLQAPHACPEAGISTDYQDVPSIVADAELATQLGLKLTDGLRLLIAQDPQFPPGLTKIVDIAIDPAQLADRVAANLTLPHARQLSILGEAQVLKRLEMVLTDLAQERALQAIETRVRKDTHARLDKQQRDFYLREQIRALRTELEDTPESLDVIDDLDQRLRKAGLPESSLAEAIKDLHRLRRMPPDAAEYNVTRTWLEWLISMPWQTTTEDCKDLVAARTVLDSEHFGLDKVKDRILEHLAVTQLNPKGRSPVLCFVGPPGVGKTSLGQSIASALNRSFQRVSLGGVKDEAEVRGHRRTYVGALPGRIIHAIKRAESRNPVIVLDEIDKIGADFRGDPTSALLEVLDPEINREFVDHYLDVPFDLSGVLFVCTANMEDPIPAALHDRLEMIELPGYTQEEKIRIAENHLLPRLRSEHGLDQKPFSISSQAIQHLVEAYTHEAGLRGLVREMSSIHRKAARRFVEGSQDGFHIENAADIAEQLGPPKHFPELAEEMDQEGVSIGLAWTRAGGDILFVEATRLPGGKELKLTGKLGEVMKESAEAAMTLIQGLGSSLGLSDQQRESRAIHLHVPAGGIPKDGPSAGIAMLTAIASLLTGRKVRPFLAMSGEITLRGKVLPVGGVREKVLAARRAKIRTIILPTQNEKDLVDVPQELRRDLEYHFVDRVEQVLALALEK